MFGQITDVEIGRELERRGLYTSALVTPPITPITPVTPYITPEITPTTPVLTPPPIFTPITPITPPVTPYTPPYITPEPAITPVFYEEPYIPYRAEEPPTAPSEPVIVYPRGYREEEEPEYIPYIPYITPPRVEVPVITPPPKEGFQVTGTHILVGAILLGIIFFFGGAPAAARAAARVPAREPEPAQRARTRTVTEIY